MKMLQLKSRMVQGHPRSELMIWQTNHNKLIHVSVEDNSVIITYENAKKVTFDSSWYYNSYISTVCSECFGSNGAIWWWCREIVSLCVGSIADTVIRRMSQCSGVHQAWVATLQQHHCRPMKPTVLWRTTFYALVCCTSVNMQLIDDTMSSSFNYC